jgi:hypothetical protein
MAQPASSAAAAMSGAKARHNAAMWLLAVEALIALAMLIFVVWWTMFHGRSKGERRSGRDDPGKPD